MEVSTFSWLSGGFATHQNLVEEVLNELLLQRSGGEQAVQIGSEELGDEVAGRISVCLGRW